MKYLYSFENNFFSHVSLQQSLKTKIIFHIYNWGSNEKTSTHKLPDFFNKYIWDCMQSVCPSLLLSEFARHYLYFLYQPPRSSKYKFHRIESNSSLLTFKWILQQRKYKAGNLWKKVKRNISILHLFPHEI